MATINVLAGNIKKGKWHFYGFFGSTVMNRDFGEDIELSKYNVKSIEMINEEKRKKLAGTAGWGLVGAVALGPLGAIGGMLLGGNKKEVIFTCELEDGRKFMASTDSKTWIKIQSANF
ncbi:MAG: hypothetical protein WC582_00225 [Patescibacteria group bacterium]